MTRMHLPLDDQTGLPTVPPGLESDRDMYNMCFAWDGEGFRAPAGDDPERHDPLLQRPRRIREAIQRKFYYDMLPRC